MEGTSKTDPREFRRSPVAWARLGAGLAAGGWGLVNRGSIGSIVISRVLSPVLGGVIAVAFLYLITHTITHQPDLTRAASRVVPVLLALIG